MSEGSETENIKGTSPNGNIRNLLLFISGMGLLGLVAALLIFGGFGTPSSVEDAADAVITDVELGSIEVDSSEVNGILSPSDLAGAIQIGEVAPDFSLISATGEPLTLSDFQGQPVIVNFWATWCAPCRFEMPELQEAVEAYAGDNLALLAVNREEEAETIIDFFDELSADEGIDFTFPSLLDDRAEVAEAYGVFNMPTTYFINAEGVVTAVHRGPVVRSQIDGYMADTLAPTAN